jgi:hypothetical protein
LLPHHNRNSASSDPPAYISRGESRKVAGHLRGGAELAERSRRRYGAPTLITGGLPMLAWLESIAGPAYATAMLWTLGALLLLVVILLFIKVIRSLSFGTFVSGGRNRKARLAVMDATAVDSHRRLVLVRRDDVEHLILIGGPTDVVVEQNIRLVAAQRRPAAEEQLQPREAVREVRLPPDAQAMSPTVPVAPQPAAMPQPAAEPAPPSPQPVVAERPRPMPVAPPQPAPAATRPAMAPLRPAPPAPAPFTPRPRPIEQQPSAPAAGLPRAVPPAAPLAATAPAAPVAAAQPPAPPRPVPPRAVNDQPPSIDDALLEELEVTLDRNAAAAAQSADQGLPSSVEDEMSKLLGDLARPRR